MVRSFGRSRHHRVDQAPRFSRAELTEILYETGTAERPQQKRA